MILSFWDLPVFRGYLILNFWGVVVTNQIQPFSIFDVYGRKGKYPVTPILRIQKFATQVEKPFQLEGPVILIGVG